MYKRQVHFVVMAIITTATFVVAVKVGRRTAVVSATIGVKVVLP